MSRALQTIRTLAAGIALTTLVAIAAYPFPVEAPATEQTPTNAELPIDLQYVPVDAALFVSVDAAQVWDNPLLKTIRKADAKTFEDLNAAAKLAFGLTPDDVKKVVLFVPKIRLDADPIGVGVLVTFRNAYDKEKIVKGAESLLPKSVKIKVVAASDRTALVLLDLGDDAKPEPSGKTGPLTQALQAAATGKHPFVLGMTPENWPAIFRDNELPAPFRPFQPLFKSVSVSAILDVGKTFTLDVRVKTPTAGQAVECEKSLSKVLELINEGLDEGLKEVEGDKKPATKDLITTMKAASNAIKQVKYSTLGNETQMSLSLSSDLPFTGAYLAAKEKIEEAGVFLTSSNNLKQIALANINYADSHNGNMPPAAVCDKTGKPLLSWRVLILPYLEQEELFKEFKLDEAWDSTHNKKLLAKMPKVYAIHGVTKPDDTNTHYRVFVGNGSGWEWITGVRFPAAFLDGTSNTIMCVTAAQSVPWTKPDELEFDPSKDMRKLLGSVVNGKVQVAMFDGSARSLKKTLSKETLHALITRAGGEVIGPDFP